MIVKQDKREARAIRHERIRKNLAGTAECPRLCVFRSNKHISAQIINDETQSTLVAASTYEKEVEAGSNIESAKVVGKLIAERALKAGVKQVVFDRGGFIYHGCIQALADAAREAGLEF